MGSHRQEPRPPALPLTLTDVGTTACPGADHPPCAVSP